MIESLGLASSRAVSRIRKPTEQLIRELEMGKSLSEALASQPAIFSERYRQIVQAGEQSTELGGILESFSGYLFQLIQLRRNLSLAMMYPVLVLCVVYLLLVFVGDLTTSNFVTLFQDLDTGLIFPLKMMESLFESFWYWFWIPPLLLFISWANWVLSNRYWESSDRSIGLITWFPGVSRVLQLHKIANFTEIFSSMLAHEIPFPQAMRLSLQATGIEIRQKASGNSEQPPVTNKAIPPFLNWLLQISGNNSDIRQMMKHAAEMYRRQAELATSWLKLLTPILLLVFIAGGATLFYVLTVFLPFVYLLNILA